MSTHTLGPWTVENNSIYGNAGMIRPFIASVEDDHGDEETNANARLIAAAPDMLLCLRNVIDSHGEVDQDLWNRIREVIANATGEAS